MGLQNKRWKYLWSLLLAGCLLCMPETAYGMQKIEVENFSELSSRLSQTLEKEVSVNIRKRIYWEDEKNGDGTILLQYASDCGELSVTRDMNVILIHDKSGSMDVNYGYHLTLYQNNAGKLEKRINYPLQNDFQWSETILEENSETDLESEGANAYLNRIHTPNSYTVNKGAATGFITDVAEKTFLKREVAFNSSCQMNGHYYLLIQDDERSGIPAWRMVQGKNLYNIENTDYHHYVMIEGKDGKSARDCALELLQQGRRVVRVLPESQIYYSEYGETKITETLYFLDVSTLDSYGGKWLLNTCGEAMCTENDRKEKSRQFMTTLAATVLSLNPENKIAYIPFWGDVPEGGSWNNYKGNEAGNDIIDISHYESLITQRQGVGSIDFTSNPAILQEQIEHPFTYNGSNWAKAFQKATEYLQAEEGEEKETLVLFFTDGMPQGTEGSPLDYKNPAISGIIEDAQGNLTGGALHELKKIEGVTVWAIGVGVNELDTTQIRSRLELVNDDGQPFYARYTEDFEGLKKDILAKIQNTYVEQFGAIDAFYHDYLNSSFVLDTSKVGRRWKILEKESEELSSHGVPKNVYEAVRQNGKDTGIVYVYVEDIKKIYWYIGSMSNGGYDAAEHSAEIHIRFLKYKEHTSGKDEIFMANESQFLTYHTTMDQKQLYKVEIESPKLVFRRSDSEIYVEKKVQEKKPYARTYRYVYSKEKYTKGTVKNVLDSISLTIPAGALSAKVVVRGLEDGTYYFYETDRNHQIVHPETKVGIVDYQPTITTLEKSSTIPWSVTGSDGAELKNKKNYLFMESKDSVVFEEAADLTLVKEIDVSKEPIRWEHGNPIFQIRVHGKGVDGKEYIFYHTFEFTKEYVEQNEEKGRVQMSHTFYDIPVSENYIVQEVVVVRYQLEGIRAENARGQALGTLQISENTDGGYYSKGISINLKEHPRGVKVFLKNTKCNETWFSHNAMVQNRMNDK